MNADLVLPVVGGDGDPAFNQGERSPHRFTTLQFVRLFATNEHRVTLCRCFFTHRDRLRGMGLSSGFQWVSGSFVDLSRQEPGDIDVVTFLQQSELIGDPTQLLSPHSKGNFNVDSFAVDLEWNSELVIDNALYWYELWTSRRGGGRKGFLRLELGDDGREALNWLDGCAKGSK